MRKPLPPGATIGIVGGGQLGRMLAMAAARLGYSAAILDPDKHAPAGQVTQRHIVAAYDDGKALEQLAKASDVITYEFENVPVAAIRSLEELRPVHPPAEALEASQDRVSEKVFLNATGISTAPFVSVGSDRDLARGLARFDNSGVLKTRRMGYDGRGQRVFRDATAEEIVGCFEEMRSNSLILEGLVDFAREISIIAARSLDGKKVAYDPAENDHRNGILSSSTVPATVSASTALSARDIAFTILDALDYVGVVGVEFFVLKDGSLLVNEIAPRVHNSGHWTEAACAVSQFEQHIRAITGLPLGHADRHSDCVMENILGGQRRNMARLLQEPDLVLHLYGKREARPGRKMGHFTRLRPAVGGGRKGFPPAE